MNDLKTLKDLNLMQGQPPLRDQLNCWQKAVLVEEAVKWIKHFREIHNLPNSSEPVSYQYGSAWEDYDSGIIFIKHFFNITEEDLG